MTYLICTYGTLRLGEGNYNWLLKGKSEYLGVHITDSIYNLYGRTFGYPIATPGGETSLKTDVFRIDADTLARVDSLEGYSGEGNNNHYDRITIDTEYGKAFIYIQDAEKYMAKHYTNELIKGGDWINR